MSWCQQCFCGYLIHEMPPEDYEDPYLVHCPQCTQRWMHDKKNADFPYEGAEPVGDDCNDNG